MSDTSEKRWAFAFALAFGVCVIAAGTPWFMQPAPRAENAPAQPTQTPSGFRTVDFGPTRYTIPDVYNPGITPYRAKGYEEGKGYAAFTLNLLVPDLKPQGSNQDGMTGHGWGRHLQALLEYGLSLRSNEDLVAEDLRWGHISKDDYVVEANGCHLYRGNMTVTQELHVCYLPDRLFVYDCSIRLYGPSPDCEVHERLNEDTTIIYSYSKEYGDNAVLFDDRIRALMISFMSSNRSFQP